MSINERELIQRLVLDYAISNLPYLIMLLLIPWRLRGLPRDQAMVQSRRVQQYFTLFLIGDYILFTALPFYCPLSWGFLASLYQQQQPSLVYLQAINVLPVLALGLQYFHTLHLEKEPRNLWHLREFPWCLETFLSCIQILGLLFSQIELQVGQLIFYLLKLLSFTSLLAITCLDTQRGTNFQLTVPLLQEQPVSSETVDVSGPDENRFAPYFQVTPLGYEESKDTAFYRFEVTPQRGSALRISRRFSQFKRLYQMLKSGAAVEPPQFPSQLITLLEIRQNSLASFLRRVLNHPAYFLPETFDFIGFSGNKPTALPSALSWSSLRLSVLSVERVYDQVNNHFHYLVALQVTPPPPCGPYTVHRKMAQFRTLHSLCLLFDVYLPSSAYAFPKHSLASDSQPVLQHYLDGLLSLPWHKTDLFELRLFFQLDFK